MKDRTDGRPAPSVNEEPRAFTSGTPSLKRPAGWQRSAPLVGRAAALAALQDAARPCALIFGEPGIGKTRLLSEARAAAEHDVFSVACVPTATPVPYDPLIALARLLHRRDRIGGAELDAFLQAGDTDRQVRLNEALGAAAMAGPMIVQIDDLHASDSGSIGVLLYCVMRLRDMPISWHFASRRNSALVVELASSLERAELARVIHLGALDRDDLRQLASWLRPDQVFDEAEIADLHKRTGGNPLYAELLLVASVLEPGSGLSDLRHVLNRRIEALDREAREVAGAVSVDADPISPLQLSILLDRPQGRIARALATLVDEAILVEYDGLYAFRHELLRDACYSTLGDDARRQLHLALASGCSDDWRRASHLDAAGETAQTAALYRWIGWECLERQASTEALAAFDNAARRSLPRSAEALEAEGGRAAALAALGRIQDASIALGAMEAGASILHPSVRAKIRMTYAERLWDQSDDDGVARPMMDLALNEAASAAPQLLPRVLCNVGSMDERRGRIREAEEALRRGLSLCVEPVHRRERIRLTAWLGVVLARAGRVPEGIVELECAAKDAIALNMSNELAECCVKLCYVNHMAGDKNLYEHWCHVGLGAPGPKSKASEAVLRANLSSVATDRGALREALGILLAAEASLAVDKRDLRFRLVCGQLQLFAMLGDFDAVGRVLGGALTEHQTIGARQALSFSAGFAAELQGDDVAALGHYEDAVAGLSTDGAPEVYHIRALSGIGRTAASLGRMERAQTAIDELRAAAVRDWPIAQRSLKATEGYFALVMGDPHGVEQVLEAARGEYPFWKAHLELIVADRVADRTLFLDAINAFDMMGAEHAADRARALARAHGLRPGRKRETQGTLSSRELSVALLIANGKTNTEVGEILHISARTVEYHVGNILSKCGLRSRVEIAATLAAGRPLRAPHQTASMGQSGVDALSSANVGHPA